MKTKLKEMDVTNLHNKNGNGEAMQEVIGAMPGWIIRWGIAILIFVFSLLTLCSLLIHFPDFVTVPVTIRQVNPANKTLTAMVESKNALNKTVQAGQKIQIYLNNTIEDTPVEGIISELTHTTIPAMRYQLQITVEKGLPVSLVNGVVVFGKAEIVVRERSLLNKIASTALPNH